MKRMNLGVDENEEIMGIDLGTTNSAVAVYREGLVPKLLPIGDNFTNTIPSCVSWDGFDDNKHPIFTVGEFAYKHRYKTNVMYSVKRIMGTDKEVKFYNTETDESISLPPYVVSGEILKAIRNKVAELYKPLYRCVITVPAYFNQRQIEDTIKAAEYAELECVQILKEPTSASYIYSQLGYASNGNVLIYDLGGGTFDVTCMKFLRRDAIPKTLLTSLKRQYGIELDNITDADLNAQYFCKVLGTYGDVNLGGDDIDRIFGNIVIKKQHLEDMPQEQREELYLRCENFKKTGFDGMDIKLGKYDIQLRSEDLNTAVDEVFNRTLQLMDDIDMKDVATIVLVGGSTKNKRIRSNLERHFPGVEISAVLDPDCTVALGAGSVAKAINDKKSLAYSDVLPLPIGVLVDESKVDFCIAKNTSMPYTVRKVYRTLYDNQKTVTLHIYQGLSSDANECTYLGRLTIDNVPPAPAGEINVVINFILNGQGQLKIISRVDGVSKEEELIIDNIMDINRGSINIKENVKQEVSYGDLIPQDEFEESFIPLLFKKSNAIELFIKRREYIENEDVDNISSIESDIFSLL